MYQLSMQGLKTDNYINSKNKPLIHYSGFRLLRTQPLPLKCPGMLISVIFSIAKSPGKEQPTLTPDRAMQLTSLLVFALGTNLPLGYMRETSRKFSFRWFVLIHLSVPFIIALRVMMEFPWHVIPLTLACAVAGQIIGSRIRRRQS